MMRGFMTSSALKRQGRRDVLVLLLAVAVAGCQSGVAPRPTAEIPVPQPGAKKKVALIVPLTGVDGPIGTSISRAAALALTDTGNQQITLTVFDSAKAGAVTAATLALGNGNALILGPLTADDVRAVAPLARKAGVPVVAFSNDRAVAGDGVFIMGTAPADSIERTVLYARGKGAT